MTTNDLRPPIPDTTTITKDSVLVGTVSTVIVPVSATDITSRKVILTNDDIRDIWITGDAPALIPDGVRIPRAGGQFVYEDMGQNTIEAIVAAGSATISLEILEMTGE